MMFGIKRTLADSLFSELIRERDNWTCVRCFREHEKKQNTLDCSHYWGRRFQGSKSTRFDFENCDSLCKIPCHRLWEKEYRDYYRSFKLKQLGKARFDALEVRAHNPPPGGRVDEKTLVIGFKAELKKLKENREVLK